jgi:hypothetical protein
MISLLWWCPRHSRDVICSLGWNISREPRYALQYCTVVSSPAIFRKPLAIAQLWQCIMLSELLLPYIPTTKALLGLDPWFVAPSFSGALPGPPLKPELRLQQLLSSFRPRVDVEGPQTRHFVYESLVPQPSPALASARVQPEQVLLATNIQRSIQWLHPGPSLAIATAQDVTQWRTCRTYPRTWDQRRVGPLEVPQTWQLDTCTCAEPWHDTGPE